jgi:hypothetical protein
VAELERRLSEVEAQLERSDDAALRRRRLVITVALVALERRLAAGEQPPDAEALLADADRWVTGEQEARQRVAQPPPPKPAPPGLQVTQPRETLVAEPEEKGEEKSAKDDKPTGVEKARVQDDPARPAALMSEVERKLADMEACLGDLDADVEIQVALRLDASGAVKDPRVTGVAGKPAGCIGDVLRGIRVRDHQGGSRVVRFPLLFSAKG